MKATIRIESRGGRTAYVVYAAGCDPMAFDFMTAAAIYCAVEGYEWEVVV